MQGINWGTGTGRGTTAEQAAQGLDYFKNAFGKRGGVETAAPAGEAPAPTAAGVATELAAPVAADTAATPDLAGALADAAAPSALEARPEAPAATIAEGGESAIDKLLGRVRGAQQGARDRGGIDNLLELLQRPKGATTTAEVLAPAGGAVDAIAGRLAEAAPAAGEVTDQLGAAGASTASRIAQAFEHLRG